MIDAYADRTEQTLICADGFDDAILGVVERFNNAFVVYDRARVIHTLMRRDGMTEDEAEEFYSINIVGAWVGEETPGFLLYWQDLEER